MKDIRGEEIKEGQIIESVGGESAQGFWEFQIYGEVIKKDGELYLKPEEEVYPNEDLLSLKDLEYHGFRTAIIGHKGDDEYCIPGCMLGLTRL